MDRIQEMKRLRFECGYKLKDIASLFGISRERVRQLIGNTGRELRKEWTKKVIESGKYSHVYEGSIDDLRDLHGAISTWKKDWGNHRHVATEGSPLYVGQQFEERASEILTQHGIKNTLMPVKHPFDILTESGIRIDVKVTRSDASKYPSQVKVKNHTYQVPELKSGKDCDLFFIFVPDEDDFTYFVIPSWEMHKYPRGSRMRIVWPKAKKTTKWHKYHKRLDLILEQD